MKYANSITIRVFIKENENHKLINEGLFRILGYNDEEIKKEGIKIEETKARGLEDNLIIINNTTLLKDRHCNKFLQHLKKNLSKKDVALLSTQENRLDDNLDFFLRLDKTKIIEDKEKKELFSLTDSGDCYHIKINIAAYPKNKDAANKVIKQIFE